MILKGIQKTTLLDFPTKVACTVFTAGCNFRCPFCHNASLVVDVDNSGTVNIDEFFAHLRKRRGILDGVCITGGEPLLQKDISEFIAKIKELGYAVKLDTNGSRPEILRELIDRSLVDYVAMPFSTASNSPAISASAFTNLRSDPPIFPAAEAVEEVVVSSVSDTSFFIGG